MLSFLNVVKTESHQMLHFFLSVPALSGILMLEKFFRTLALVRDSGQPNRAEAME